ncbi:MULTISPECIES: TetR/AcrR family transcriptional regulator [unclassified Microbispora]|uniref:TetR/AcrR family transcriptional regulator n=1 Tax=unclassified Microbispora TaxID=2614687 RepID=UPI0014750A17|nr:MULTISPECIES: TetR/AcrR family transcriptional regulator [unclassified Microbispora]
MIEGDTAARIAATAREILVAEGAEAVTMRRVAEAVGVTPMAIYRHFPGRDALLGAVAEASFREMAGYWGRRGADGGWEARMNGLLDDFLDFALSRPHLYTFLITDRREEARRFPEDFRGGGAVPFSHVVEGIEQGMREGRLRPDDPLEVAMGVIALVQGLVQLYLGNRIGMPEQEFRSLCERSAWRMINGLTR